MQLGEAGEQFGDIGPFGDGMYGEDGEPGEPIPPGDQLGEYPGEKPASEAADGENPAAFGVIPILTPVVQGIAQEGVATPAAYGVI